MIYQPAIRPFKGMQTMARPAMSAICDECSKIRQAAGFIIKQQLKTEAANTTPIKSDRPQAQPAKGYKHRRSI
ncbi:hypothetical protein D3C77_268340 [compost metagenome]